MNTKKNLHVNNLSCVRQHRSLFTSISFELYPSQILLVEGPNGSGKSSLLRILSGLSKPHQGSLLWEGQSIYHLPTNYTSNLHYISHTNGIKLGLTVIENLQFIHAFMDPLMSSIPYTTVLEHLQLSSYKNTLVKFLSAGQKRRLALAKLFLFPRALWILDEPLTALDHTTQTSFLSYLHHHVQKGGLVIMSSHHFIHFPVRIENAIKILRLGSCSKP